MNFFTRLFGGDKRNDRLAAWGKTVPLTQLQQKIMWELYQSMKTGVALTSDPLRELSDEDKEYLFKICSSDFRPPEFGNADVLRVSAFRNLRSKGYSNDQSAVLVGMMFNMVGRKDL